MVFNTFNGKTINELEESDLIGLIGNDEGKGIDFKKDIYPKSNPKSKQSLCEDVSSFANSKGGWIICGMDESGGVAKALCGLPGINAEKDIQRLEQLIYSGIEPRVPGVHLRPIRLTDPTKEVAIVIYIPPSFAAPHIVEETHVFHLRRSNQKLPMNLEEVRQAFGLSDGLIERIKEFRETRIKAIISGDESVVPSNLWQYSKIVLHIVPIGRSASESIVDMEIFRSDRYWLYRMLRADIPINHKHGYFNFDGYCFYASYPVQVANRFRVIDYIQFFRNGAVEYVRGLSIDRTSAPPLLVLPDLEHEVIDMLDQCLNHYQTLKHPQMVSVMVTLTNAYDHILLPSSDLMGLASGNTPMDYSHPTGKLMATKKSEFHLPEQVSDVTQITSTNILKPIFDILWNIGGYECSRSYDSDGNYITQSRR